MSFISLALKSEIPLVYVRTDDPIHVETVLKHLNGDEPVMPFTLPPEGNKGAIQFPEGASVYYTSSECKWMTKLYRECAEQEKSIVFINTEKSILQLDCGTLIPPKELVLEFLQKMGLEAPEELMPAFGGMTLKDIAEVAKMTMTRDDGLSIGGINETRRGYTKLQGITQVDTDLSYYLAPEKLDQWLAANIPFFKEPKHPTLIPRGLLADGPPGTGKTLAAKFIARAFGVPLYRLDLGAMMGRYVGDSEGNLNAALAQVDQVEPAVIILDEVEKVFQSQSDSGVTSRMLSQLLWWLQEHKSKVFTVMTTNAMNTIPKELYREGRIDITMQFLGIEGKKAGYDFALGAYESMMAEMQIEPTADSYAALQKRVNALYGDGLAVPQSKLTQTSNSLVREVVSGALVVKPETAPKGTLLKGGKAISLVAKKA